MDVTIKTKELYLKYKEIRDKVEEIEEEIKDYAEKNGAYITDYRRSLDRKKQDWMDKWRALTDFVYNFIAEQIEVKRGQREFEIWGKTYVIKDREVEVSLGWKNGKGKEWSYECINGESDLSNHTYDTKGDLVRMVNYDIKQKTWIKMLDEGKKQI